MFIADYYFSVKIRDCLFLEFDMPDSSKNPFKMLELKKIKQNFCNIVDNMSLC